jgi:hypothetical protein
MIKKKAWTETYYIRYDPRQGPLQGDDRAEGSENANKKKSEKRESK